MPARSQISNSYGRTARPSQGQNTMVILGVLAAVIAVVGGGIFGNLTQGTGSSLSSVGVHASALGQGNSRSAPAKTYHIVFDPPFPLSQEQRDFQQMAKDIITSPSSWGVYKPALQFDPNLLELYTGSVLWSENKLSHYDADGNVAYSYSGCCLGAAQVLATSSVCPLKELKDVRYNIWCGARIFLDYYQQYGAKAGSRANEVTVALYKNAVETNADGSLVLDDNGLPIIPPHDPKDPYDFASQVASAFVYDGKSMFKFVAN